MRRRATMTLLAMMVVLVPVCLASESDSAGELSTTQGSPPAPAAASESVAKGVCTKTFTFPGDVAAIFADGFESGNTNAWSSAVAKSGQDEPPKGDRGTEVRHGQ